MPCKHTVHIVEDDLPTLKLLENITSMLGYKVASYSDSKVALDTFRKEQPAIVISDWQMPEVDGLEICADIRSRKAETYTYFILQTAQRRSRGNLELAIDAGVDEFLKKPVSTEEIWNRLRIAERILGFTSQVKQLESLIPICCYCKKIRNDDDLWEQVEQYVNERTGADFTHSICPCCMDKHVRPELDRHREKIEQEAAHS